MIGKKCNKCGDKVLILKEYKDIKLCLDCLEKLESNELINLDIINKNEKIVNKKDIFNKIKRKCSNCKRIIPEDAKYCPYCQKKFW